MRGVDVQMRDHKGGRGAKWTAVTLWLIPQDPASRSPSSPTSRGSASNGWGDSERVDLARLPDPFAGNLAPPPPTLPPALVHEAYGSAGEVLMSKKPIQLDLLTPCLLFARCPHFTPSHNTNTRHRIDAWGMNNGRMFISEPSVGFVLRENTKIEISKSRKKST